MILYIRVNFIRIKKLEEVVCFEEMDPTFKEISLIILLKEKVFSYNVMEVIFKVREEKTYPYTQ